MLHIAEGFLKQIEFFNYNVLETINVNSLYSTWVFLYVQIICCTSENKGTESTLSTLIIFPLRSSVEMNKGLADWLRFAMLCYWSTVIVPPSQLISLRPSLFLERAFILILNDSLVACVSVHGFNLIVQIHNLKKMSITVFRRWTGGCQ